jgi:hypothetical protein
MPCRSYLRLAVASLTLFFGAAVPAFGEQIHWGYEGDITTNYNYSSLTFTGGSGTAAGSTLVLGYDLKAKSLLQGALPHFFSKDNGDTFQFNLRITDAASGETAMASFSGFIEGTVRGSIGENADYRRMKGEFLKPLSQALRLGNNLYTVTVGETAFGIWENVYYPKPIGWSPGSKPNSDGRLTSAGYVQVDVMSVAPEPSSLVMAATGVAAFGVRVWRRLRRRCG